MFLIHYKCKNNQEIQEKAYFSLGFANGYSFKPLFFVPATSN